MKNKKSPPHGSKKYMTDQESINNMLNEPEVAYQTTSNTVFQAAFVNTKESFIKRTIQLMGLSQTSPFNKVKNISDFIYCIREGVPKKAVDNIIGITGMGSLEVASLLHTSDRNLRRYADEHRLNAEQSERIIEIAKVYSRGEDVFGTLDAFNDWMNSPLLAFAQAKPKEYLDTSMGIEMLMEELGRIEHGIFA